MDRAQRVRTLSNAYDNYLSNISKSYDEVLREVIDRVRGERSLGKLDIAGLTVWKRISASTRWADHLMSTPDAEVRTRTADAFALANDLTKSTPEAAGAARNALSTLPGFGTGDALASAVCYVVAPERLAVYDDRAHDGLLQLGLELDDRPQRYRRYITHVEQLREELSKDGLEWSARKVDLSLFVLGKDRSLRRRR